MLHKKSQSYLLLLAATFVAVASLGLADCGGGAGNGAVPSIMSALPTSKPTPGAIGVQAVATPNPTSGAVTRTCNVTSNGNSTHFNFCSPVVDVYYHESMVTPSAAIISVGQSVTVSGTWNIFGGISASSIAINSASPSPSPNPTGGPVVKTCNVTSLGNATHFNLCSPSIDVYYHQNLVVPSGSNVSVGQNVTVTGTWNVFRGITAALVAVNNASPPPSPTPGPYHIATWANDAYWAAGENASAAQVAQLVSFAESGRGNDKALRDCKAYPGTCKSVYYFDPNVAYDNPTCPMHPSADVLNAASEDWFVHATGYSDRSHRANWSYTVSCNGNSMTIPVYNLNTGSAGVQGWWRSELRTLADGYDVFFMDDTHAKVIDQYYACLPWPSYCRTTQEVSDDNGVVAAHTSFVNALNHSNGRAMQFAFNSMNFDGQDVASSVSLFTATSRFIAGSCEGCAVSNGRIYAANFPRILNTMAAVNKTTGAVLLHSTDSAPSGSSTQIFERFITVGLVWLGYSEGHTIAWEDLEDATHGLSVWPEELIYPSAPVQTMSTGASDLQVSSGIYRREFGSCFQASSYVGRCAAIVNSTASNMPVLPTWLSQTYGHVITVAGGDILSGGSASINSTPFLSGVTVVPAQGAVLLAQ